jgi:hypothetical protein
MGTHSTTNQRIPDHIPAALVWDHTFDTFTTITPV